MSIIHIPPEFLSQILLSGEAAYPEEGVGFLLGREGEVREVLGVLPIPNSREEASRNKRYMVAPDEYKNAEDTAERLGLSLIGVFHSHPDHPNQPSEYDKDWAQPLFSYVITSVKSGKAGESRSWRLSDDRSSFIEETITT
ncbi:MAG: hypothetical protein A2Y54_10870 [Chloroflexi bacterium RBG_16_51_16]|nr:MAG: hypothetical protein A2Y54_10870 [Chloroflexi bacterium RBG_16_51_16]